MKTLTTAERRKVADALDLHEQYVYQVLTGRKSLPKDRCPAFEAATGVACELLRPDVRWVRLPDPRWHWHPDGRPLIDTASEVMEGTARAS